MSAPLMQWQRETISECGHLCEYALRMAHRSAQAGREVLVRYWQGNAEFWADRAFRVAQS